MKRRTFISLTGMGAISGCTAIDNNSETTATPESTKKTGSSTTNDSVQKLRSALSFTYDSKKLIHFFQENDRVSDSASLETISGEGWIDTTTNQFYIETNQNRVATDRQVLFYYDGDVLYRRIGERPWSHQHMFRLNLSRAKKRQLAEEIPNFYEKRQATQPNQIIPEDFNTNVIPANLQVLYRKSPETLQKFFNSKNSVTTMGDTSVSKQFFYDIGIGELDAKPDPELNIEYVFDSENITRATTQLQNILTITSREHNGLIIKVKGFESTFEYSQLHEKTIPNI